MKFRSVFISDTHLGTRWCKAKFLSSFLSSIQCEQLYLVGDIIDGWKIRKKGKWPQSHNKIIRKLLKMSKKTDIKYITGNHDEFMDEFDQYRFGNIQICRQAFHNSADDRNFLVVHGDEYDIIMKYNAWLAHIGDFAYDLALWMNSALNIFRSLLGFDYWSLSMFLKHSVKDAVKFIGTYEGHLIKAAEKHGVDGIICGHIHKPGLRKVGEITYCNTGDWVESCSALVEHFDGSFEVIRWYGEEREGLPAITPKGDLIYRRPGEFEPGREKRVYRAQTEKHPEKTEKTA